MPRVAEVPTAVTHWHTLLPQELLIQVLKHVATDAFSTRAESLMNLYLCSRVSRTWSLASQGLLYWHVELRTARSASRFMRTLRGTSLGSLVHALHFWTGVYTSFTPARNPLPLVSNFPSRRRRSSSARTQPVCSDRFLDAVMRQCPNLTRVTIQNRAENEDSSIFCPTSDARHFQRDVFRRLVYLELDLHSWDSAAGSQFWLTRAFTSGDFDLPQLEELRLRLPWVLRVRVVWPRLPALRRLVVTDATILRPSNVAAESIQALIDAASPSLEDFRANMFDFSSPTNFLLPPTVKRVYFHECRIVPSPLSDFLSPCIDSLVELGLCICHHVSEDSHSLAEFKAISFLQVSWEFLSNGNMQFLESMLPRLRILEVIPLSRTATNFKESPQELTETADIFIALVQGNAPHLNLESLTIRGNPSVDGVRLSALVQSIFALRTVGVSINIVDMYSFLTLIPMFLSHLELHVEGTETGVQDFFSVILPTAYASLQHLESIRTVECQPGAPSEVHWKELSRSEIFSRFLAFSNNAPMITCTVEDTTGSWTTPTEWVPPSEQPSALIHALDVFLETLLRLADRSTTKAPPGLDVVLAILWILVLSPILIPATFVALIVRSYWFVKDKLGWRRPTG